MVETAPLRLRLLNVNRFIGTCLRFLSRISDPHGGCRMYLWGDERLFAMRDEHSKTARQDNKVEFLF